ncbi:MAG: outer membrane beta-barrel protein [Nitrospirota bacterium]
MKRMLLFSLVLLFVFASTSLYAAEKYALGMGNVALKVDYFSFTDDIFDEVDLKDGVYVGLEAYYGLMPNLYLGLEGGWAGTSEDETISFLGEEFDVETDVTLVPVELNLKFAGEIAPSWVIGVGAGISYSWFNVDLEIDDENADEDDWVLGGQVFAEITYKMSDQWFLGINGKYHFTEDIELGPEDLETDTNANNWRVGAHIGLMF